MSNFMKGGTTTSTSTLLILATALLFGRNLFLVPKSGPLHDSEPPGGVVDIIQTPDKLLTIPDIKEGCHLERRSPDDAEGCSFASFEVDGSGRNVDASSKQIGRKAARQDDEGQAASAETELRALFENTAMQASGQRNHGMQQEFVKIACVATIMMGLAAALCDANEMANEMADEKVPDARSSSQPAAAKVDATQLPWQQIGLAVVMLLTITFAAVMPRAGLQNESASVGLSGSITLAAYEWSLLTHIDFAQPTWDDAPIKILLCAFLLLGEAAFLMDYLESQKMQSQFLQIAKKSKQQ